MTIKKPMPTFPEIGDYVKNPHFRDGMSLITRLCWDGREWAFLLANGAVIEQWDTDYLNPQNIISRRNTRSMEALVEQLKQTFPALGLSFGYIGNCGHDYDDRGWRVFTNRRTEPGRFGTSISFHLGGTDELESNCRLRRRMDLVTFCAELNSQNKLRDY